MATVKSKKIGVALSGGGYRAAAFHLGTLRKLNQMNKLHLVDVFSTVSGGSIVGADYVLSLTRPGYTYDSFENNFIKKLHQGVIGKVLTSSTLILLFASALLWLGGIVWLQFTCYYWAGWIVFFTGLFLLIRFQFVLLPVSKIIENVYQKIFFGKSVLGELPSSPSIVINSTNLSTGRPFSFSKNKMNDSTYEFLPQPIHFSHALFPVARAVMASSCVPFAFTPVPIAKEFYKNVSDYGKIELLLIDGGVFDNQGMHKLTAEEGSHVCDIIITSDAGNKMSTEGIYGNVFAVLLRSMDLFMGRIKKFQVQENLYLSTRDKKREIAYVSLGWDIDQLIPGFINNIKDGNIPDELIKAHEIDPTWLNPLDESKIQQHLEARFNYSTIIAQMQSKEKLSLARHVGTNLTALSPEEISALINQAELMTELQIKLYCPSI